MNIKLEILKEDGQTYWTENFESLPYLKSWLEREKARPYWQESFSVKITPEVQDRKIFSQSDVRVNVKNSLGEVTKTVVLKSQDEFADFMELVTNDGLTLEIVDTSAELAKIERINSLVASGESDDLVCKKCICLIGGHNKERLINGSLVGAQINQMISTFSNIDYCLEKNMPKGAKPLIVALEVDEVLVTSELKDLLLEVLKEY